MSALLEEFDGQASYVGRKPGWHNLGIVEDDLTYQESLRHARLAGWNVRAEPLVARVGPDLVEIDGHQLILRDHPGSGKTEAFAGVVGDRYEPIQNEQAFAIAEHLEALGATVETAGSIRGGRQTFVAMALPSSFVLDPEGAADHVNGYLLLATSHDGTLATQAGSTYVRVVCANTFDIAIPGLKRTYKVRHTATGAERLAEAQAALVMANKYGERLAQEAAALYRTSMDAAAFIKVATNLYPKPDEDKKGAVTRWEKKIDLLGDLFDGGGDVDYTLANVRRTAWAGLNALTERLDWHRKARGGDGSTLDIARMGLNPAIQAEKNKARSIVVEWAKEQNPKAFTNA